MGVWEYCFNNFRYPYHQYDQVFDGCKGVLSNDYIVIREWLLPGNKNNIFTIDYHLFCTKFNFHFNFQKIGWLLALEFLISIGLFYTLGAQLILAGIVTRYPLKFILKQEHILIPISFVASVISCS